MAKYKIIPSSRTIVQSPISIGHKAEKGVEAIEFDLTAWVETYGSGTLTVVMRRWGDAIPYPIALEIDENNKATWTLSDTDTAKAGMAYAQLNYIVGDEVVKKSDIYTFSVMDSLTGEGEPPEAYESWLEHLTHLAAEAMAEVLDIEGVATDKTLTIDGGIADAKATGEALAEKVDAADYRELSNRVGRNTIALAEKADRSTTYTKAQVDQMISDVEVETDTTLEIAGAAADAKKVGDELSDIKADLDAIGDGLSEDVKTALLACFAHVEWQGTGGKTYYDTLSEALYPQTGLVSITASFNPGQNVIYTDTPLNDLKAYLTVTGTYSDSTTQTVHLYSLTGTLAAGTSTITVSYEGKTTTFTITVVNALDRIAYNNVTYRDMFITNNYVTIGDFETISIPETEQTLPNGDTYKVSNGSPTIASGIAVSGSKSLKVVSTSTSAQLNYVSTRQPTSANMLSAACIRVDSYTSGSVGMQVNVSNAEIVNPGIGLVYNNAVTEGFVEVVKIREYSYDASTHPTAKLNVFIGDFTQGKADAYIDLCVVTEIPSGMTLATAEELYHNFVNMVKNS